MNLRELEQWALETQRVYGPAIDEQTTFGPACALRLIAIARAALAIVAYEDAGPDDGRGGWLHWEEKHMNMRKTLQGVHDGDS